MSGAALCGHHRHRKCGHPSRRQRDLSSSFSDRESFSSTSCALTPEKRRFCASMYDQRLSNRENHRQLLASVSPASHQHSRAPEQREHAICGNHRVLPPRIDQHVLKDIAHGTRPFVLNCRPHAITRYARKLSISTCLFKTLRAA